MLIPQKLASSQGIHAIFDSVLCVRQSHGVAFGKSDLFFVCALKPSPGQDTLCPQESEIEAAQWMAFEAFSNQEFFKTRIVFQKILQMCQGYIRGRYKGLTGGQVQDALTKRHYFLLEGQINDEECTEIANARL